MSKTMLRIAGRRLLRIPTKGGNECNPRRTRRDFDWILSAHSVRRLLSSSRRRGGYRKFQLDALPFSVTVDEALKRFDRWSRDEGIVSLLSLGSTKITPTYAPFYYFDLNVRFLDKRTNTLATPEPFRSAYPQSPNGVLHLPGVAAYAGFSFRRSLIDPIHNTTPLFLQGSIVPFGQWMLEPIQHDGELLHVEVDPWNATKERAFNVVYEELQDLRVATEVTVETERLSSRRIYMPTYVIDYTLLGISYRAFISACDGSIGVSGTSHTTTFSKGSAGDQVIGGARSFLSDMVSRNPTNGLARMLRTVGFRVNLALPLTSWFARVGAKVLVLLATRLHIVALAGGILMGYRKLVRPFVSDREAGAEWERQRVHEAQSPDSYHEDSFRDTGIAKRYFEKHQRRILRALREEEGRGAETDGQEWYSQWEQWAREQFEQAQRHAYQEQQEFYRQQQHGRGESRGDHNEGTRHRQQQRRSRRSMDQEQAKKKEYDWDFDPSDPYSVLGIKRGATKDEVSKAFRREMLKHHPDVQAGASEEEKDRATERSKLVSDAYRKIKSSLK